MWIQMLWPLRRSIITENQPQINETVQKMDGYNSKDSHVVRHSEREGVVDTHVCYSESLEPHSHF